MAQTNAQLPADTVGLTGSGTPFTIPMFTGTLSLGDSVIKQNGTGNIGVGGIPFAGARLGVTGNIDAAGDITVNNVSSRSKITATGDINGKSLTTSGDVTASGGVTATGAVSAAQYKIGTNVVLGAAGDNTVAGIAAGTAAGSSLGNSIFGASAGSVNPGQNNSVFGARANNWGTGSNNAFFGTDAGYFGAGNENSYFGRGAGQNTFTNNRTTLIGAGTGVVDGAINATAIGAHAFAGSTDTLILGSVNGTNGATSEPNVGVGTTTPQTKLHVANGDIYISLAGRGLILKSTTGLTCTLIRVNDSHQLFLSTTNCPGGITPNLQEQ
jgi:hypothetical protein